jgi:small subunit ribosomal protein S2
VAPVGIRELLEAGVHFGHQTRRWNPKMRRFIFGERQGIYIIDLLKTERLLESAQDFAGGIANRGGNVLFVGTKKQARDSVKEIAESAGMPYVNHRWLGGLLTNFQTISLRIKRLHDLERYEADGQLALLPTRERLAAEADLEKLRANLGGVKHMQRPPDALFVIDLKTELIAVREAQRLRIPIIGLVDTNCDPDGIDYVIPGNDDAIKACRIITKAIGDVVSSGRQTFREEEERARQEAEAQARREAEEKARREAEEEARKAAEAAEAEALLTQGGEGLPRDQAEQVVAEAVQQLPPRRQVEGRRQAEAGAPAGAGEPASDTAGTGGEVPAGARARQAAREAQAAGSAPAVPAPEPGPSAVAEAAAAEAPPAEPTAGSEGAPPEPAVEQPAAEDAGGDEGRGPVDRAQAAANAAVDTAQDVANAAVDTAQDAAAAAVDTAAGAVEAVGERLPGPLGGIAKAAAGAAGAAADAVKDRDKDEDEESK